MIDLHAIKRRYGGDISGNTVKIPTPRHSRKDRGTSITLAPDAPDGCLVHCFNDYDPLAIKDMLRRDGFLPPREQSRSYQALPHIDVEALARNAAQAPEIADDWQDKMCWDYTDAEGSVLYRKKRVNKPDGSKSFIFENKGDQDHVLYRLPDLIAGEGPVFVAEGEKCADKLASWGLAATSSKDLDKCDLRALKGRSVFILPDNDQVGAKIAAKVTEALMAAEAHPLLVELPGLPEKGDIMDWKGSREDRIKLAGAAYDQTRKESASQAAQDVVEPWPEPVDLWASPEAPSLPEGLLPSVIENFARAKAESMGCDPAGIAMAALATCAGAISDEIKLQPKRNENWTECARIWVGLVGNPSTRKSPILKAAIKPLRKRERELAAEHAQELSRWLKLSKDEQMAVPQPIRERRLVEDATIEALQTVLKDTSRGIMSVQDEMSGWFGRLEKYSTGGGSAADRAFWLQAYNGGGYSVDRVGRGSFHITNNSISLAGGIQPEPLRNLANGSHDDGLIQRIIPVMLAPAQMGSERSSEEAEQRYRELFERLELLKPPHEAGTLAYARTPKVTLSSAAQAARWELEAEHMELVQAFEGMSVKLATALGKHDGLFCRLCLIWHCIETDHGTTVGFEIGKDTAERVAAFLRQFIRQHLFSFHIGVLGASSMQDKLTALADWIASEQRAVITARDVNRSGHAFKHMDPEDIRKLFEQLDMCGWGNVKVPDGRAYKPRFEVNPRAFELFAQRGKAERQRRETAKKLMAVAFKVRKEVG